MRRRLALLLALVLATAGLIGLAGTATSPAQAQSSRPATYAVTGARLQYLANPAQCEGLFGINLSATFSSPKHAADGVAWRFAVDILRGKQLIATVSATGTPYRGAVNPTVDCAGLFRAMSKGFLAARGSYRFVIKRAVATIGGRSKVVRAHTGDTVRLRRSTFAYDVAAAKARHGRSFTFTGQLLSWRRTADGFGWKPLSGTVRTLDDCAYTRVKADAKGRFRLTRTVPKGSPRIYLDLPPGSAVQPAWAQQYKVKDDGTLKPVSGRPACA